LPLEVNVHSSTSSFRQLPHGWFSLVIGGVLSLALLGGWEVFWRSRDYAPTLTDTESLWCHERRAVAADTVVIVGSSRVQTGLDPAVLSRALGGRRVVQLAINGANAAPALHDLANDSSFAGTVIYEYMPLRLFTSDAGAVMRAQGFVHACHNSTLTAQLDRQMSRVLQQHFVFMNSELHPINILSYVTRHHSLPRTSYGMLRADRFLALTFSDTSDGGDAQSKLWEPDRSPDDLARRLDELAIDIAKIQRRGGKVVLYRPPVTKGVLADEEMHFPAAMWLPRAARQLGVPTIDFSALPEIRNIECRDGGHLAAADVPLVTEVIGRELRSILAAR
jgi:hypothetical protein